MSLKIYFGPYEKHGVITHRTQKLNGIIAQLTSLGYDIEMVPVKRLNALIIHFREKEIFRCDIRFLKFNIDFEDDPVAQNLVKSVEETRQAFNDDRNVAKFNINKKIVFGDTHEYLSEDVDLLFEIPAPYKEVKFKDSIN